MEEVPERNELEATSTAPVLDNQNPIAQVDPGGGLIESEDEKMQRLAIELVDQDSSVKLRAVTAVRRILSSNLATDLKMLDSNC